MNKAQEEQERWNAHIKDCRLRVVCCFCDKPMPRARLSSGVCQECDDTMCASPGKTLEMVTLTFTVAWAENKHGGKGWTEFSYYDLDEAVNKVKERMLAGWKCVKLTSNF